MAIPSTDRIEYPASSTGTENTPQNVLAKSTLWTLQLSYGSFYLKEYSGYFAIVDSLQSLKFHLTPALKADLTIDTDRFWIWNIDYSNELTLIEMEPFTTAAPTVTYTKSIASNIRSVSVYIRALDELRLILLTSSDNLRAYAYQNIRLSDPPKISTLNWSLTRPYDIASFVNSTGTSLDINYLDIASPPNVYTESYTIDVPTGLNGYQTTGGGYRAYVGWNPVAGSIQYVVERSTDPGFNPVFTVTAYTGTSTNFTDILGGPGTYYYRVKAQDTDIYLESAWSSGITVVLVLLVAANFTGTPTSGEADLSVVFTDTSSGTPTGWSWTFGDGGTSTAQNPTHIYTVGGTYTVVLTVTDPYSSDTLTRTSYIYVNIHADFSGTPTSGNAPLLVQFTDLSLGVPDAWEWDFGDGISSVSRLQNPRHYYTRPGTYPVTLTIRKAVGAGQIDIEVKAGYITVNAYAIDFIGVPRSGSEPLMVQFTEIFSNITPDEVDWNFGDGQTVSGHNPLHVYRSTGTYTVRMTIRVNL